MISIWGKKEQGQKSQKAMNQMLLVTLDGRIVGDLWAFSLLHFSLFLKVCKINLYYFAIRKKFQLRKTASSVKDRKILAKIQNAGMLRS